MDNWLTKKGIIFIASIKNTLHFFSTEFTVEDTETFLYRTHIQILSSISNILVRLYNILLNFMQATSILNISLPKMFHFSDIFRDCNAGRQHFLLNSIWNSLINSVNYLRLGSLQGPNLISTHLSAYVTGKKTNKNPQSPDFLLVKLDSIERGLRHSAGRLECFWMRISSPTPRFQYWFVAVPFAVLIWVYDEVRKLFIRRYPGSK